jgi:hypothetical protein
MEAILDKVVRKVSEPSAAPFLGVTGASHAYRLAGYGALFVVPPRALPRRGRVVIVRKVGPEGLVGEWSQDMAPGSAAGGVMEGAVSELRSEQNQIDEEIQVLNRSHARGTREKELRAIEEKVKALQKEAQRTRQDAERALEKAMQEAMRELQIRAATEGTAAVAPPPPLPPVAALAPPTPLPPAPPWRFWFNSDEREDPRPPARVVADVKGALAQALEAHGARLRSVRPEEFVAVAVDFVSAWGLDDEDRTERTLIVRVRKKDLEERQAEVLRIRRVLTNAGARAGRG